MAVQNRVHALPIRSFNSASATASYQALNGAGIPEACFILRIYNDSDQNITISYDGTTDNDIIIAGELFDYNFSSMAQPGANPAQLAKGTKIYGKGTAGTGTIYITGYFVN